MRYAFLIPATRLPPWLDTLAVDYCKKLSLWFATEVKLVDTPSRGRDSAASKIQIESQNLLDEITSDDFVVLCDERGTETDSLSFAKRLEKILNSGKKRLVFVVGGAYGVNDDVKSRADLQLSLSPFTMNHHLALAVVFEQIFRAMSIMKGTAYHNE